MPLPFSVHMATALAPSHFLRARPTESPRCPQPGPAPPEPLPGATGGALSPNNAAVSPHNAAVPAGTQKAQLPQGPAQGKGF